ncbi:MAG: hypothetical protein CVV51_02125 [Spirochaetae bacterium HGW-Spirochaetae-7]|nr:MAG: hypothetical protein CVV51_02125 [Spirochaetae bacterium HGW-Spirochaetae-7]
MLDAPALIGLINAAGGSGPVVVDTATLRLLLDLAVAAIAALAACIVAFVACLVARSAGGSRSSVEVPSAVREGGRDPAVELRRQLDAMVRKTNDRNNYINSIFSSIEDGLLLVDPRGRVSLYNPRAMELLGLGPELLFERREADIASGGAVPAILAAARRVGAEPGQERLRIETEGGRILDVRISPIADKYRSGKRFGSLAVVEDVTELRRLENLRKDFVANVSHEFRTPLTLISGFVEMFKMRDDIPAADRERAFEIMDLETERLKRLVSELLTLSEIENELPLHADEVIDVAGSLSGIVQTFESLAARKGLSFTADLGRGLPSLRGDENWFYLAVKNLVENAIKYTPAGSVALVAGLDGDVLSIEVTDTGVGISQEELERVFDRFYRVEKSRGSGSGGSGLGLSLVKDIAAMFGGSVTVRSEPGLGSTFALNLPLPLADPESLDGGPDGH